jgi:hypothetical protein
VVNTDSLIGKIGHRLNLSVTRETWDAYRSEIDREAKYARDAYGMVVLAGCELTRNAFTGNKSAHALALGLDSFVSADGGVEEMLTRAREAGAVTVACHPNEQSGWFENTYYLWKRRREVGKLIDLWEVACRWDLFPPVSKAGLSYLANSDFHSPKHLFAWKTLADCEKTESAVLSALRKGVGFGVTRLVSPVPVLPSPEPEPTPCGCCLPDLADAQPA